MPKMSLRLQGSGSPNPYLDLVGLLLRGGKSIEERGKGGGGKGRGMGRGNVKVDGKGHTGTSFPPTSRGKNTLRNADCGMSTMGILRNVRCGKNLRNEV